mmetsp:Transcript_37338/g.106832  ORF Transcript_37338/g.106832 Transcript_37338/m.106832 type:complete len:202 (-) Transcript_37338:48-653(-)
MDGINQSYHCMHLSALHVMYHSSSLIHGSLEPSVVVSLLNYRVTQQIDGRHIAPQTDREGERDPHTAPHHTAPHRTASHRTTPPRQQPSTRLHSLHTDTNAPAQNGERALCVCVSVCDFVGRVCRRAGHGGSPLPIPLFSFGVTWQPANQPMDSAHAAKNDTQAKHIDVNTHGVMHETNRPAREDAIQPAIQRRIGRTHRA